MAKIGLVEAVITSDNSGTNALAVGGRFLNVVIDINTGSFVGTVSLQRRFIDGGVAGGWIDIKDYSEQSNLIAEEFESKVEYRLFCKTGNYTSGSAYLRLSH